MASTACRRSRRNARATAALPLAYQVWAAASSAAAGWNFTGFAGILPADEPCAQVLPGHRLHAAGIEFRDPPVQFSEPGGLRAVLGIGIEAFDQQFNQGDPFHGFHLYRFLKQLSRRLRHS